MADRKDNERRFPTWDELSDGGRRYYQVKRGKIAGYAQYVKKAMITQEMVVEKILAHLNGQLSERELVHWAEDAFVDLTESEGEIPNERAAMDALMYIGAGDSPGFPLTWEILSGFLEQLGTRVKVTPEARDFH